MTSFKGLYGITSKAFGMSHENSAHVFLEGGFRIIQYREKHAGFDEQVLEAGKIKKMCEEYDAAFVVNDRVDVALGARANIVHVGQEDLEINDVKKLFRGEIGVSASSVEEAVTAERNGAAYLGVGTVFSTSTKTDGKVIGIEMLAKIRKDTRIPIIAIGGITTSALEELKEAGADGIAVISAVLAAHYPVEAAKDFVRRWEDC